MSSACVCHLNEWCFYCEMYSPLEAKNASLKQEIEQIKALPVARTLEEWHEDYGDVLWWAFPIEESPYCGSPLASDWPDYHTHWTPVIIPTEPIGGTTHD